MPLLAVRVPLAYVRVALERIPGLLPEYGESAEECKLAWHLVVGSKRLCAEHYCTLHYPSLPSPISSTYFEKHFAGCPAVCPHDLSRGYSPNRQCLPPTEEHTCRV